MKLVELAGGTNLYIPKYDSCVLEAKSRRIYDEWRASKEENPYITLAKKYNYSETHVRRIVREKHMERMPKRQQLELF
jgi:Mor family transcriptional regulator